jgi:hypothetical protein
MGRYLQINWGLGGWVDGYWVVMCRRIRSLVLGTRSVQAACKYAAFHESPFNNIARMFI